MEVFFFNLTYQINVLNKDAHVIIDEYGDVPTQAYFGLYDGHGGKDVSDLLGSTLHIVKIIFFF